MNTTKLVQGLEEVKGKTYIADSLKFIHSYKKSFSTVLGKIAKEMNENKQLIDAMNKLVHNNEDFKELIDILVPYYDTNLSTKVILEKKKKLTNTDDDYYKLVKPSIEYLYSTDAKERIHTLLIDILKAMINDTTLMDEVNKFKNKNKNNEWKKMVGMLIPEGASVMLTYPHTERNTSDWNPGFWTDIFRKTSGKPIKCTVSKRGLMDLDGAIYGKKFKKQIMLPKELLFKLKRGANSEVLPEYIELFNPETTSRRAGEAVGTGTGTGVEEGAKTGATAETGKGEAAATGEAGAAETVAAVVASGAAATAAAETGATAAAETGAASATEAQGAVAEPVAGTEATGSATGASPGATGATERPVGPEKINPQGVKGGSQRLTRKNTKTMGTARKTRTNH